MFIKRICATLFLILAALFFACDNLPIAPDPGDNALVMVTHASPDASTMDVLFDSETFAQDLAYPLSTRYTAVAPGTHAAAFNAAGTGTVLLQQDVNVAAGNFYSVFACDRVANLTALVLLDEFSNPDPSQADLRFLHLSPDAPAVDLTLPDGTVLYQNLGFKQASPFSGIPLGTYDLQVRLTGTSTVLLEIPGVSLLPTAAYTLWLRGLVAGGAGQELGAVLVLHKFLN